VPIYLPLLEVTSLSLILYVFSNFNMLVTNILGNGIDCYGCTKIMGQRKLLMHTASYIKYDLFK